MLVLRKNNDGRTIFGGGKITPLILADILERDNKEALRLVEIAKGAEVLK